MSNQFINCTVALLTKGNSATISDKNATSHATDNAIPDLFTLATRVLSKTECKPACNTGAILGLQASSHNAIQLEFKSNNQAIFKPLPPPATKKSRMNPGPDQKSCIVASPLGRNPATINIEKINELKLLIGRVSDNHGGDDILFLKEYIDDILSTHDLDKALACFRKLVKQLPSAKCRVNAEILTE